MTEKKWDFFCDFQTPCAFLYMYFKSWNAFHSSSSGSIVGSDCAKKARAFSRLVFTQILWPKQSNSSVKHLVLQHCLHSPKSHLDPAMFGQFKHNLFPPSRIGGHVFFGFRSYKGRSTLEQKVPKITVRWRLKYQNSWNSEICIKNGSQKCKQTAEIRKQTAVICKQTAVFEGK